MTTLELRNFQAVRNGAPLSGPLTAHLDPGTVVGVVGPNGVGKSTLLGAIAHTGIAHAGEVRIGGQPLAAVAPRRRAELVAFLAQDLRAPAELRVAELVAIGARAGRRPDITRARDRALAQTGIAHLADRRYGALSGGQRQLTQLARVLAQDTPVVVLDEPTAALDLFHQRAVEHHLHRLRTEGKIVLAALHDLSFALNACSRVLLLDPHGGAHLGAPHRVLSAERVHAAYGVRASIHTTSRGRSYLATDDPPLALPPPAEPSEPGSGRPGTGQSGSSRPGSGLAGSSEPGEPRFPGEPRATASFAPATPPPIHPGHPAPTVRSTHEDTEFTP